MRDFLLGLALLPLLIFFVALGICSYFSDTFTLLTFLKSKFKRNENKD